MKLQSLTFTYDIESTHGLPFITLIEGDLKGMCFLIDSGSTECVLFQTSVNKFKDNLIPLEEKGTLWGVGNQVFETHYVGAVIEFCGKTNNVPFQVMDDAVSNRLYAETGIRMHGILGTNFMRANNMLIDFVNQRVLVAPPEFKKSA